MQRPEEQPEQRNEREQQKQQATFWLDYSHQLAASIRYSEALTAVERSLALDAGNAEAWYLKGTCLGMLAQYEQALAAFEQALSVNAAYAPAWDGKAWVLGVLGSQSRSPGSRQPRPGPRPRTLRGTAAQAAAGSTMIALASCL